jgi:O-acetyl-ADP-ribose deacetylase (regulator of RNase III)
MSNERIYTFGASKLTLRFADLLASPAEVLVSSDDHRLSMGGGVSAAIRDAAGTALVLDASKAGQLTLGDVVVTTAGALPARYVFHVVTIGPGSDPAADVDIEAVVRSATKRCLGLLEPLGVSSIAFPALGTGAAHFPVAAAASAMADVIAEQLERSVRSLDVSLSLYARAGVNERDFVAFYEEFAKRTPQLTAHAEPSSGAKSETIPEPKTPSRLLELEQRKQRLESELILVFQSGGDPAREQQLLRDLSSIDRERLDRAASDRLGKKQPVRLFVSYAREDALYRDKLHTALSNLRQLGVIEEWQDNMLVPGDQWDDQISDKLETAQIILFLISPDFMDSTYIASVEVKRALERHAAGEARLIPIVVRDTHWEGHQLSKLHALPKDARPVSDWENKDRAYLDIANGIAKAVDALMPTNH